MIGDVDLRAAAAALRRLEAEDGADGTRPGSPASGGGGGGGGLDDDSEEDGAAPPPAPSLAPAPPPRPPFDRPLPGAFAGGSAPAAPPAAPGISPADALFGASVDALLAEAPRGRGGRPPSKRPRGGGGGGGGATAAAAAAGSDDGRKRRTDLPRHLQPLMGAATLAYLHGRLPDAVATLRRVITEAPKAPAPYRTLALIARERGDAGRALNLSLLAAHLCPRDVGVWRDLAADSVAAGRVDQAVYCLGMALKASGGKDVGSLSARAELYARVGNAKRAAEAYARLAVAVPVHPVVAVRLASLASSYSNGYRAVAGVSGVLRRLEEGGVLGEPFGLGGGVPLGGALAAAGTAEDGDGVVVVAGSAGSAGDDDPRSRGVWRWRLIRILARLLARTRQWGAAAALLSRVGMQVGAGEIDAGLDEQAGGGVPVAPAPPRARPVMALDLRVRLATCHVRLHSPALATRVVTELLTHPTPAASHTEVVWDLAEAYRGVGDLEDALFFYGLLDALPDFEYSSTLHFHMSRCRRLVAGGDVDGGGRRGGVLSMGRVVAARPLPREATPGAEAGAGGGLGLGHVPFPPLTAPAPGPPPPPALPLVASAAAGAGSSVGLGSKRPRSGDEGAAPDPTAPDPTAPGTASAAASAPVVVVAGPVAAVGASSAPSDSLNTMEAAQVGALAALRAAEAAASADNEAEPFGVLPPMGPSGTPWAVRPNTEAAAAAAAAAPHPPRGLPTLFDTPLATDGATAPPPGSGVFMPYRRPRKPYTPVGGSGGGSGGGGAPPPSGGGTSFEIPPSFRQRSPSASGLPGRPITSDAGGGGGGGPSWAPSYNSRSVTAAGAAAGVREVLAAADGWFESGLPARYLAAVAPLVELSAGVVRGFLPRDILAGGVSERPCATHDEELDAALRAAVATYAMSTGAAHGSEGGAGEGAVTAARSLLAASAIEEVVPMEGLVVAGEGRPTSGVGNSAEPTPPAVAGGSLPAKPAAARTVDTERRSWRTLWWRNGRRAFGVAHVSRAVTTALDEAAFVRLTERLLASAAAVDALPAAAAVARRLASQRRFHGRTRAARMRLLAAVAAVVLRRPEVAATELRSLVGELPHAAGLWRIFLDAEALASGRDALDLPVTRFMTRLICKAPAATPLSALMGHESAAAGSHGYALAHYAGAMRAVPRCALVALCIGVQYLQAALSRRTRNRNDQVLRAFVHLDRYRELRVAGAVGDRTGAGAGEDAIASTAAAAAPPGALHATVAAAEADYNLGRGFHMMGLLHLAVPLYRRVLAAVLPPSVARVGAAGAGAGGGGNIPAWLDVRRDAAFNLATIYMAIPGSEAVALAETQQLLIF